MSKHTDDILYINNVLRGNKEDFAVLVNRHSKMAYNVALNIVKNTDDAKEIVQEAFIKAYEALPSFKHTSKFSTWFYSIVFNLAISSIKKNTKYNYEIIDDILEDTKGEEDFLFNIEDENQDKIDKLKIAVSKLNYDEQVIINLFYIDEISIAEVATITQLSVANVKVKLHRIRKKLFDLMQ